MKAKKGRYRLSPNEEAQLLKEETEKRRKLRLIQVREQAKQNATKVRNAVRQERQKQIQKLATELQDQLEKEKDEKVRHLEEQYENCLRSIGHGHKDAGDQDDKEEERQLLQEEYKQKAESRGRAAMDKLRSDKIIEEYDDNKHIIFRNAALEVERNRAAEIAALPPPPPDPTLDIDQNQKRLIKTTDATAFSSTHYHMSQDYAVDRVGQDHQADARRAAEEEEEKMRLENLGLQRLHNDRMARARVRHQHALKKEMLKHDYDKMLMDLSDLQRADRDRRQKVVANIPKQVFEPPYKRLEDREDNQKVMEEAFEDMYMAETNYAGDISLALDPHPPPECSSVGESLSESGMNDVTPIPEPSLPRIPPVLRDMTNMPKLAADKSPQKKPEKVLRKLMDKIKSQREEWNSKSVIDAPELDNIHQPVKDVDHIQTLSEYTLSEKGSPEETSPRYKYSPPEKQARVQKDVLDIPTAAPHTAIQPGAPIGLRGTLMHPMETAQQIRQKIKLQQMENDEEDGDIYTGHSETKKTVHAIMEQQRQMEKERKELEEKLRKLEEQQRSLSGSLAMTTGTLVTTEPSKESLPPSSLSAPLAGYPSVTSGLPTTSYPPASGLPTTGHPPASTSVHFSSAGLVAHRTGTSQQPSLSSKFTTGAFQPFSDNNKGFAGPMATAPSFTKSLEPDLIDYLSPAAKHVDSAPVFTSSLPVQSTFVGVPVTGGDKLDLSKVREYQNNLLSKHEHSKQILAQTRAEIEKRRQELLKRFPQLDLKPLGASQFSVTAPKGSSLPGAFQQPDAGLKPDQRILSQSPSKTSISNLLSTLASQPYYASRLTEPEDSRDHLSDIVNQSKPSVLSTEQQQTKTSTKFDGIRKSLPFDADESMQETPLNIKSGIPITNANKSDSEITTESEMEAMKEDMDESTMSSSTDRGSPALPGRRSRQSSGSDSSLLNVAKDRNEFFERRQADLKKQLREIKKQKEQILQRHKMGQQKLQAQQDMLRDKMSYAQTFELSSPTNTEDSRDEEIADDIHERQPDLSAKSTIPLYRPTQYLCEHQPHELSTIQEVDTPRSTRKSLGSGRPSLSSSSSSVSRRSLNFNKPGSIKIQEEESYDITPTDRRTVGDPSFYDITPADRLIAGDPGYQTAKLEDIMSKAREFDPSMVDRLKRRTNDVLSNEESYNEDSVPRKSGVSGSFVSLSTGPLTPDSLSTGPVDDTSISAVSQPTSLQNSFAFKYVNQTGRDESVRSSMKSSWASELSSYNDKFHSLKPDTSARTSFDSRQDGSFKVLKPTSEKSFDSELSNYLQEATQDSSGKLSNLEINRGSGTDISKTSDRVPVDRSYDVLHMRYSSASEYYSLPSGIYGRKDSGDGKTLTDVSERPSSEDISHYSLQDKLSDQDTRLSKSENLERSPSDLRSSEISQFTLPTGKDSSDFTSPGDFSEKSELITDGLSQTSVDDDITGNRLSNLSQYPLSEKSETHQDNSKMGHSPSDLRAIEKSHYTILSDESCPKDFPVRRSPIGDLDVTSSTGLRGDSTTSWSEDVTSLSSGHHKISRPHTNEVEISTDNSSMFSPLNPTSQMESSDKPSFGRKLDFTSTPFITSSISTKNNFSELSQHTITPNSNEKTHANNVQTMSTLSELSQYEITPSSSENFVSLPPGFSQFTTSPNFETENTKPGISSTSALSQYPITSDSSVPAQNDSLNLPFQMLTPYTDASSSIDVHGNQSLSQYSLKQDTAGITMIGQDMSGNVSHTNGQPSLSQYTIQEDPSLSQYSVQSDAVPALSQYTITSDKQNADLSLSQYSLDKTENFTHDSKTNMSDSKGINSLSQYSITTDEDDSFVQKKFANLDQLIKESRNLIEKHKQLVNKNKEWEEKEKLRSSTPEKRPGDFSDINREQNSTYDKPIERRFPSTLEHDSAGVYGVSVQMNLPAYSNNSRFMEDSQIQQTTYSSEIDNIEQKEHETGISEEPDLTLVTLSSEVSMVEEPSQHSSAASESVLSFERHEQSLADSESPSDNNAEIQKDLNLHDAFLLHRQNFQKAAHAIKSRSMDTSPQRDAGESNIFRAVPVLVSPTLSLSMEFSSSQGPKFTKPPVTWTKDDEVPQVKSATKEQAAAKTTGKKVPPPVPQKPQKPVPTQRPKSGLNKALQPRGSDIKKHAVVSPEKPGAISLGDLISSTKDIGPHQLKKTEVRKPQLSPRSFQPSSMKSSKPSVATDNTNKKPATQGALSKTLASWKKSRSIKSTGPSTLPLKTADLPSSAVKVLPIEQPQSVSAEEYESNMRAYNPRLFRLNRSLEDTDTKTKKSMDEKQKQAAANRDKVKDFQKRLQETMRKKQQQRKEKK